MKQEEAKEQEGYSKSKRRTFSSTFRPHFNECQKGQRNKSKIDQQNLCF